jgi:hypothetical protein
MELKQLQNEVAELSTLVAHLINGGGGSHTAPTVDLTHLEDEIKGLRDTVLALEKAGRKTVPAAVEAARAGVRNTVLSMIQASAEPLVREIIDLEKSFDQKVRDSLGSVNQSVRRAEDVASASANASADLLLAATKTFSRG